MDRDQERKLEPDDVRSNTAKQTKNRFIPPMDPSRSTNRSPSDTVRGDSKDMSRAASPPLLDPFAPLWPFHRSWLETRASQIPFSPILQSAIGRLSDEDVSVSREAERPFSERSVLTRVAIACDSAAQQAQDPAVFAHLYLPLLYVSDALSFEEGSGSLEGLVERPASAGSSIGVVSRRFLSARSSLPLTAIRGASGGFYKEFIHLLEDLGLKPVITCPGPGIAQLSVCLHHGATLESSTPRPSDPTGLGLKLPSSPKISEPLAPEHIASLQSGEVAEPSGCFSRVRAGHGPTSLHLR